MAGDRMYFQRGNDFRTIDGWGIVLLGMPLKVGNDVKEPYKNEWLDEHGDEEWNSALFMQAYEIEVSFGTRSIENQWTVADVRLFLSWLQNGEFMFWSEYGNYGKQHVRYVGYNEDATLWSGKIVHEGEDTTEWILRFKLKFKVNDPVTNIVPNSTHTGLRVLGS